MQPTEHKRKNDEELITHIKQSLKTHEEFYQLGAWEKFNEQQQPKRRPIFWLTRLSGAAAILAVCFSLIWFTTRSPQTDHLVTKKTPTIQQEQPFKEEQYDVAEAPQLANEQQTTKESINEQLAFNNNSTKIAKQDDIALIQNVNEAASPVAEIVNNTAAITTPQTAVNEAVNNEQVIALVENKSKSPIEDFLTRETKKSEGKLDKLAVNQTKRKWDLGLMLAPSIGNNKELNIGYGMSMSYNFSDRLSLTSGIAYNKMNASKNLTTSIGRSPILLGNTKSLEMINEEVTGIDIPLELKYNINKNVYANLGVSGFAVLNQRRNNTFVEQVVIKSTANGISSIGGGAGSGSGASDGLESQKGQFANSYIVSQRTTERASSAAIEDVNYIGFYNFSFGYTKKVYKNHALSIEPFVKLPIKMVTQDNLRLMGTGVRVKVGF